MIDGKLRPASADAGQVRRVRIVELARREARLVLIRAPAGYGKTTAMVQLQRSHEQSGTATAWLTLDAGDNDISRFMHCLTEALRRLPQFAGRSAEEDVADATLFGRLARCSQPFVLFFDDMEAVHNKAVLDTLQYLVDQLPACGQLVIGSRTLPELRLARMRARRQLVEVDAWALRFSLAETRELLGLQGHSALAPDDVQRLHVKTEGWIVGLWLASMALEGHPSKSAFIARFSGSSMTVADYLLDDVFRQQGDEARDFLMRTSVLRVLTPPLCEALVPGVDCARMLRELSAHNVMLTPIDAGEGGYRYHSLFASFLQAQLRRHSRYDFAALHEAAARWLETHGRPIQAIDHLLEADRVDRALALISEHMMTLLAQGRMRLLARWFSALPKSALEAHPRLQIVQIWAVCFTRGPSEAMERLQDSGLSDSEEPEVWPLVSSLQPVLLSMMDRYDEACEIGQRSLARLPSQVGFADDVLINIMSHLFATKGLSFDALRLMDSGRQAPVSRRSALNSMYAETMEGMLDLFEGRIHEAQARFHMAIKSSCVSNEGLTYGNAWPGILYAASVYERNDVATAAELLRVYLPMACDAGLAGHMIHGYRMLARIAFDEGDVDECFRLLCELESLGHQRKLPRVVASAHLERSRVQLLQGRAPAAHVELERANSGVWRSVSHLRYLFGNDADDLTLGRLRWEAVAGDARHAALRLAREAADAAAAHHHRRATALRLVHVIALIRCESTESALSLLAQTLRRCATQGFIRLILDEGPTMGMLVGRLAASLNLGDTATTADPLAFYVRELVQAFGGQVDGSHEEDHPPSGASVKATGGVRLLLDPLTQKELHVLRLLADGYSNSAICEKLFVSDSTVRTHLRHINSKLAVGSRAQAVSAARQLGLIR